ncbi:MAG TPA: ABC transporter ATP-binding protein [Dokdonella sp.]|uniref:ABC transporter ATP-binding protein n=1 Tax=Dokdonella sp. TaxID=2291710 RepID=UPI002D806699|nr:ABC transporter ATP-binding protein [Dokdonella sp.]HET9031706.1 ABC transporter ATP-binding protein [Dokdonella sp.]
MSDVLLRIEDVGVTYGKGATALSALRDISLDVRAAEVTLLLGPSGSGKTTLLQVMGCLLRPTRGRVSMLGQPLHGLDTEALTALRLAHVGFVFQHYNLFPTLRAWENVAVALDLKQVPAHEQQAAALQLLDRLDMADRATHFPSELSGGQKQRVAIARALAGKPGLILADEPTAALDSKAGQDVVATLQELAHGENCAVVIVSHDPRVEPYADRVLHLEDGRLVDDRRRHGNQA